MQTIHRHGLTGLLSLLMISVSLWTCQARADGSPGTPFPQIFYIDGNDNWAGFFHSRIGTNKPPVVGAHDFSDALGEFADPEAARKKLLELKRARDPAHGAVFAGFRYLDSDPTTLIGDDFAGEATLDCGVTTTDSHNPAEIRDSAWSCTGQPGCAAQTLSEGSWAGVKASTRDERIRAVARCLAGLPGMPALKPSPREIRYVRIDEPSYTLWERWLRGMDQPAVQGSRDQYRLAIRCLVSEVARRLPDATGDTAVLRLIYEEVTNAGDKDYRNALAVTSGANAMRLMSVDQSQDMRGPWPAVISDNSAGSYGVGEDRVEHMLPGYRAHLAGCRRRAGLFELPPARISVGTERGCAAGR